MFKLPNLLKKLIKFDKNGVKEYYLQTVKNFRSLYNFTIKIRETEKRSSCLQAEYL